MTEKNIAYYINKIADLLRKEEKKEESVKRYAFFPVLDEKNYEFYQKQEITHWSESELDFIADRKHYDSSTPQVKRLIDIILAFFLTGDGIISDNIVYRFLLECKTYEEKSMFISQLHIELIHAATYGLAALTFKRDPASMADLLEKVQNTECVKAKMKFMEKWMLADRPRYQRLVAFACAEGIFFCTLFAVIFWFRSKGLFPNFIFANELIGNDESLHRDFGAYLFGQELISAEMADKIRPEVEAIVKEAIEIEDLFADAILESPLEDLNAKDLKTYARLIADNLLTQLSYTSIYQVKNPFTWLNDISLQQKGNFYEVRIGSYKKKSLAEMLDWRGRAGISGTKIDVYADTETVDF